jgi:hypothetical protein
MDYPGWDQHMKDTAAWLVTMAANPGFVDHARHREQELMRNELYADLPRLVREARAESAASERKR